MDKVFENFSFFSIICLHYKWNGTRLLSPKSKFQVATCVAKQFKTENLRNEGILWKIFGMLAFYGKYPAVLPKAKFWSCLVKSCEKSPLKHSIEKCILLKFENLSQTFCPWLSVERKFYFWLSPGPSIINFLQILVFERPICSSN